MSFTFGSQSPAKSTSFSFGGTSSTPSSAPASTGFSFGGSAAPAAAPAASGGFSFGASANAPSGGFGSTSAAPATSSGFGFGSTTSAPTSTGLGFGSTASAPASTGFGFGSTTTTQAPSSGGFGFGTSSSSTAPATSGGFGFGASTTTSGFGSTTASAPASTGFSFGGSAASGFGTNSAATSTPSTGFGFGTSTAAPATSGFGFGGSSTTATNTSFGFGAANSTSGFGTSASNAGTTTAGTLPPTLDTQYSSLPPPIQAEIDSIYTQFKQPTRAMLHELEKAEDDHSSLSSHMSNIALQLTKIENQQQRCRHDVSQLRDQAKQLTSETRHTAKWALQQIQKQIQEKKYLGRRELTTDTSPLPVFTEAVSKLESLLQDYIREIQEMDRQMIGSESISDMQYGQKKGFGAEQLVQVVRNQHAAFMMVSSRVAEVHEQVHSLKTEFMKLMPPGVDPFLAEDRREAAEKRRMEQLVRAQQEAKQQQQQSQQPQQQQQGGFGGTGFGGTASATPGFGSGFGSNPTSGFGSTGTGFGSNPTSGFGSTGTGFGSNTSTGFGGTATGFGSGGLGTAASGFGGAGSFGAPNSTQQPAQTTSFSFNKPATSQPGLGFNTSPSISTNLSLGGLGAPPASVPSLGRASDGKGGSKKKGYRK